MTTSGRSPGRPALWMRLRSPLLQDASQPGLPVTTPSQWRHARASRCSTAAPWPAARGPCPPSPPPAAQCKGVHAEARSPRTWRRRQQDADHLRVRSWPARPRRRVARSGWAGPRAPRSPAVPAPAAACPYAARLKWPTRRRRRPIRGSAQAPEMRVDAPRGPPQRCSLSASSRPHGPCSGRCRLRDRPTSAGLLLMPQPLAVPVRLRIARAAAPTHDGVHRAPWRNAVADLGKVSGTSDSVASPADVGGKRRGQGRPSPISPSAGPSASLTETSTTPWLPPARQDPAVRIPVSQVPAPMPRRSVGQCIAASRACPLAARRRCLGARNLRTGSSRRTRIQASGGTVSNPTRLLWMLRY